MLIVLSIDKLNKTIQTAKEKYNNTLDFDIKNLKPVSSRMMRRTSVRLSRYKFSLTTPGRRLIKSIEVFNAFNSRLNNSATKLAAAGIVDNSTKNTPV
jgi:hypothetical protein